METKILNYRVIIEPEKMGQKIAYNAYCPTLGLADFGDSVELALSRIQKLIKFHIRSLVADRQTVPSPDQEGEFISIARVKVQVPHSVLIK